MNCNWIFYQPWTCWPLLASVCSENQQSGLPGPNYPNWAALEDSWRMLVWWIFCNIIKNKCFTSLNEERTLKFENYYACICDSDSGYFYRTRICKVTSIIITKPFSKLMCFNILSFIDEKLHDLQNSSCQFLVFHIFWNMYIYVPCCLCMLIVECHSSKLKQLHLFLDWAPFIRKTRPTIGEENIWNQREFKKMLNKLREKA